MNCALTFDTGRPHSWSAKGKIRGQSSGWAGQQGQIYSFGGTGKNGRDVRDTLGTRENGLAGEEGGGGFRLRPRWQLPFFDFWVSGGWFWLAGGLGCFWPGTRDEKFAVVGRGAAQGRKGSQGRGADVFVLDPGERRGLRRLI